MIARLAAAIIAAVAWTGLGVQIDASIGITGAVGTAAWAMLRYFTIITNLLVALAFSANALGAGWARRPVLLGGLTLAIMLVGVIYALLLRGLLELSGGAALADLLLHTVTPILVPLYWLAFGTRGGLRYRHALLWGTLPLLYLPYAFVRGAIEGIYAYPFLNVVRLGWPTVSVISAIIATGFLAAGLLLVWLDGQLERKPTVR